MTYPPQQPPPGPPYQPPTPGQSQPGRRRPAGPIKKVLAVVGLVLIVVIVFGTAYNYLKDDPFGEVSEKCGHSGISVADGGDTLVVDGKGGDDLIGADINDIVCVLDALKMPTSVRSEITATRALDGRQQGTWGDYRASWSYHPDTGLNLVVTRT
jgi:hypothetical protein